MTRWIQDMHLVGLLGVSLSFLPAAATTAAAPAQQYPATALRDRDFASNSRSRAVSFSTHIGREDLTEPVKIAVDTAGNIYVAGFVLTEPVQGGASRYAREPVTDIYLTKLNAAGRELFTVQLGGSRFDAVWDMAVDSLGRAYLVGETESADFPVRRALQPHRREEGEFGIDAFLLRVAADGSLDYSTYLGGNWSDSAYGVAVDAGFNAFVTGSTLSDDFPITPGVLKPSLEPQIDGNPPSDAFVTKISPDGQSVIFSTFLGGTRAVCGGLERCPIGGSHEAGRAIAIDHDGNIVVAGESSSSDFPTTAGAVQNACLCSPPSTDGFMAILDPNARTLLYGTLLGGNESGRRGEGVRDLGIDAAGNILLAGGTESRNFPTTLVPFGTPQKPVPFRPNFPAAFVAKIDPRAGRLVFSTYLNKERRELNTGFAVDPSGRAYLTGLTDSAGFPVTNRGFAHGSGYFMILSPDGSKLEYSTRFLDNFAGASLALSNAADVYLVGSAHYVSRLAAPDFDFPPLLGVTSAARDPIKGNVSPGELISILGTAIGPAQPLGLQFDVDGKVSTTLGGIEVLIGGIPAPITHVQSDRINAVVPLGLAPGTSATFVVRRSSLPIIESTVSIIDADPGIFSLPLPVPLGLSLRAAAALNQDGTINSPDNPALPGTTIAVFATGFGPFDGAITDGEVRLDDLPRPRLPVRVLHGFTNEVQYIGQAPGLVAGVIQLNLPLPTDVGPGPTYGFHVEVAGRNDQALIFVRP